LWRQLSLDCTLYFAVIGRIEDQEARLGVCARRKIAIATDVREYIELTLELGIINNPLPDIGKRSRKGETEERV
jgi:hypothetical protein